MIRPDDAQPAVELTSPAPNETASRAIRLEAVFLLIALLVPPTPSRADERGACLLLEAKEIASVQGEAPKELKAAEHAEGPLRVQECVVVLPTYAKSISLQLTRGPVQVVRERWRGTFHSAGEQAKARDEEDRVEPMAVRALGDESFWLDVPPSGVLYVLRRAAILRISVGGPGERSVKLKHTARLARKALRRL